MSNAADSRSTHTDALATLGTIIDKTAARDAIHLAVEPVIAGMNLQPGDHVGWDDQAKGTVSHRYPGNSDGTNLGIVDPFLTVPVAKGEMFWLIVYPRQITSLRHVWAHPSFPEAEVA